MKYLLLLSFLTSCAWHSVQEKLAQKEAQRTQTEFINFAKSKKVNLNPTPILFVIISEKFPKEPGAAGVCHQGLVYLDQFWWRNTTVWDKEQVILHELGHCALNLTHQKGIMGTKPIPSDIYFKHKQTLLEQMFKPRRKPKL